MGRARHRAGAALIRTGLMGGSFNPGHRGHRKASLQAMARLGLDELWWLVSPGNPLKDAAGDMAPFTARFASARAVARRSRIRVSDIETRLGSRYTIDTVRALRHRYPNRRFIWVGGTDLLHEFHKWRDWKRLAALVPIAVMLRPGYNGLAVANPATAWLRRFVRVEAGSDWTRWRPPALVLLHLAPDPTSATALRRRDPDWHRRFPVPISPVPPTSGST